MRSLYADVIRPPLPRNIKVALSRIEREQSRAMCQGQRPGGRKPRLMAQSDTGQKRECQENRHHKDGSAGPRYPSRTAVEVNCLGNCHPLHPMAEEYCGLMAI